MIGFDDLIITFDTDCDGRLQGILRDRAALFIDHDVLLLTSNHVRAVGNLMRELHGFLKTGQMSGIS